MEIIHEATKIPMDALRAIEEGYSTRMLTPFYYRGFIKIYAEFLGLNVAEVLKEYNVKAPEIKISSPSKPTKSTSSSKSKPKAPTPVQKVEPNLFWEELQITMKKIWTPKTRMLFIRILVLVVGLFIVMRLVGCVASALKNRPKASPKKQALVKEAKKSTALVKKEHTKPNIKSDLEEDKENIGVKEEKEIKKDKEAEVDKESDKALIPPLNNKVTLVVHASRDSWIQVKADGKVAFQMTMKKGTMENWEAKSQIELSGKNLGDLELEVNGMAISSLGAFNRRAKKVLITKDGLTVKK